MVKKFRIKARTAGHPDLCCASFRDVSMQMVLDILGRAYVNDKTNDLASDDELWSMLGQQRPLRS